MQTAWLRHMACEMLHAVPERQLQEFQQLQMIKFCLKVCDPPPPGLRVCVCTPWLMDSCHARTHTASRPQGCMWCVSMLTSRS